MKISKLSISKVNREGYPGKIVYANFNVDGIPLTEFDAIESLELVSCLGWGPISFQKKQIKRLLLDSKSDLENNRNSLYICPCTDLGCGAVSLKIRRINNEIIAWSNFCHETNDEFVDSRDKIKIGTYYFEWKQYKEAIQSTLLLGEPDYWHGEKRQ
ncbi:hypothetical protein [Bacillus sp. AFS041924]|uniref:hypothetical protein n=1 Tax=Bacillus sp. AFS041924 TaxID=2033503 RepID=UPI000BFE858F|nr:hypothetical protein [Bacillus sp. AFS041924]PGS54213.1 hypothetical protein COC46_05755 [Bacillus sp. AFS041924]